MLKRLVDIVVSFLALIFASPVILLFVVLVYLEDRHSPFYVANRVARGGSLFKMIKLRSMVVNAHLIGASSTAAHDPRITRTGVLIRKYNLQAMK